MHVAHFRVDRTSSASAATLKSLRGELRTSLTYDLLSPQIFAILCS